MPAAPHTARRSSSARISLRPAAAGVGASEPPDRMASPANTRLPPCGYCLPPSMIRLPPSNGSSSCSGPGKARRTVKSNRWSRSGLRGAVTGASRCSNLKRFAHGYRETVRATLASQASARLVEVAGDSGSPDGWDPRTWGLHHFKPSANACSWGFFFFSPSKSPGQNFSP